ncbi:MAG: helix-turn-helix transcriptional regulator [Prevotellaceae bacterium]|nr:helix-turn-helix transcriptional regulator [Prevotellaceae bacterium]
MNINGELNDKFMLQRFENDDEISAKLDKYQIFAAGYADIENAIAVLSDLKERRSYIYYGGMAQTLGISPKGKSLSIDSIWEEEIFRCIIPEDLERKHLDELKFIHFLRSKNRQDYSSYYLTNFLSMIGKDKLEYIVRHRVFYVGVQPNGSIRLALCLYNLADKKNIMESNICDSISGKIYFLEQQDYNSLLSKREKETLELIFQGYSSKEISATLLISIHTVNRHRQNILSKLRATNSVEACKIAKQLKLIQ